jgi:hypothetical protein
MKTLEQAQKEKRELVEKLVAQNKDIQLVIDIMKQSHMVDQKQSCIFTQPSPYNKSL